MDIESKLSFNLVDPFQRFIIQDYKKFKILKKEIALNSNVRKIIKKKYWCFNNFSTFTSLYSERNSILTSQVILTKMIKFLEENKDILEKENFEVFFFFLKK